MYLFSFYTISASLVKHPSLFSVVQSLYKFTTRLSMLQESGPDSEGLFLFF